MYQKKDITDVESTCPAQANIVPYDSVVVSDVLFRKIRRMQIMKFSNDVTEISMQTIVPLWGFLSEISFILQLLMDPNPSSILFSNLNTFFGFFYMREYIMQVLIHYSKFFCCKVWIYDQDNLKHIGKNQWNHGGRSWSN